MKKSIGIRREDKNNWEKRTPLIPEDVAELKKKYGIKTIVQPSSIRVFTDDQYRTAGAEINENLDAAQIIFAVKEIPKHLFKNGKTYVFFSHTVKGQKYNMPMLRKMIKLQTNLIDYERIVNKSNQRLIFFGRYAGIAGMIETLVALGTKLRHIGLNSPFENIKQPYQYPSLEIAKQEVQKIGQQIKRDGIPTELAPMTFGFAGYGNVSRGAQEIFDLLPHQTIEAEHLKDLILIGERDSQTLYKIVFKENNFVIPKQGNFNLQDYYNHPEKYAPCFDDYLPFLSVLVNCIYWTEKYPRLVTREYLKRASSAGSLKLSVIGDISCDINGSIEITSQATMPDQPSFTYLPSGDNFMPGVNKEGITVMAVDNLPCEFSRESSAEFSAVLKKYINPMLEADFNKRSDQLDLPYPIKKAMILHGGQLTEEYKYMKKFI